MTDGADGESGAAHPSRDVRAASRSHAFPGTQRASLRKCYSLAASSLFATIPTSLSLHLKVSDSAVLPMLALTACIRLPAKRELIFLWGTLIARSSIFYLPSCTTFDIKRFQCLNGKCFNGVRFLPKNRKKCRQTLCVGLFSYFKNRCDR